MNAISYTMGVSGVLEPVDSNREPAMNCGKTSSETRGNTNAQVSLKNTSFLFVWNQQLSSLCLLCYQLSSGSTQLPTKYMLAISYVFYACSDQAFHLYLRALVSISSLSCQPENIFSPLAREKVIKVLPQCRAFISKKLEKKVSS